MKRIKLPKIGPVAILAGMLGSLAIAAPTYNSNHAAPRSVFLVLPWDATQQDVLVRATQTPNGTWRLQIDADVFQFTEICTNQAEAVPIGHAHIILNWKKVGSAYSPVYDLGQLPPGEHHISVVLRGQDHRALLGRNGLIMAEVTIRTI